MYAQRFFPFVLIAAVACSETANPSSVFIATEVEEDYGFETFTGTVVSSTELRAEDGTTIKLMGPQTELLGQLVDAEVRIRGTWDEIGGGVPLWVVEFRVLMVDNLPAFDGILQGEGDGYTILDDDEYVALPADLPTELMGHIGSRVWLTLRDDSYVRFGVLEMQ
jgi:hypothetical protein